MMLTSNFIKICPLFLKLKHTDRWADMISPICIHFENNVELKHKGCQGKQVSHSYILLYLIFWFITHQFSGIIQYFITVVSQFKITLINNPAPIVSINNKCLLTIYSDIVWHPISASWSSPWWTQQASANQWPLLWADGAQLACLSVCDVHCLSKQLSWIPECFPLLKN
jgi:hypothetical protein